MTDAINSLGTNLLSVRTSWRRVQLTAVTRASSATNTVTGTSTTSTSTPTNSNGNGLTLDDAHVIATMFPQTVSAVDPQVRGNVQVRFNGKDTTTNVTGATVEYPFVNNASVDKGRWFTSFEDAGNRRERLGSAAVAGVGC